MYDISCVIVNGYRLSGPQLTSTLLTALIWRRSSCSLFSWVAVARTCTLLLLLVRSETRFATTFASIHRSSTAALLTGLRRVVMSHVVEFQRTLAANIY